MTTNATVLRIAKKVMKGRPLQCTRTEEEDKKGGRLQTTSLMWYRLPRSKKSSWIQVMRSDYDYYRAPSGRKKMVMWSVTTLHIEYGEAPKAMPIVVVFTHRHTFPTFIFQNHGRKVVQRASRAEWHQKPSNLARAVDDVNGLAARRQQSLHDRAFGYPFRHVAKVREQAAQEVAKKTAV